MAAMVDDIVKRFDPKVTEGHHPVRQPLTAHDLRQVVDAIERGAARRRRHEGSVGRHAQRGRAMSPGLIEGGDSVGARREVAGDLPRVQAHGLAVSMDNDETGNLVFPPGRQSLFRDTEGENERVNQRCAGQPYDPVRLGAHQPDTKLSDGGFGPL